MAEILNVGDAEEMEWFEKLRSKILKTDSEISWSNIPGCFARHLQRKRINPLFPVNKRSITQDEAKRARQRRC
jgi:hypothetical protein